MRTFLLTDLIRRTAEMEGLSVGSWNITDGLMADDTDSGRRRGQGDGDDKVLWQAALEGSLPSRSPASTTALPRRLAR